MPEIRVKHIVSCSSEDKNHCADNLLRPEGSYKWKGSTPGEKSISVVLQLEKASQIHSIDIGNEGSAFVEVLVGRSTSTATEDYQVLLVASSFMTPLEARNGNNRNSVRMFSSSKLSAPVASQKWDRVKVVCTQPFNKTSTFGISFIKFHSPSEKADESTKTSPKPLGFFKMKEDEEAKDDIKAGSLFSHRGKEETSTPKTVAAAVRAAARSAEETRSKPVPSTSTASEKPSSTPTPKPAVEKEVKTYTTPPVMKNTASVRKPSPSPAQQREKRKHNVSDDDTDEEIVKPKLKKQSTSVSSVASKASSKGDKALPLKKTKSEPPKESKAQQFSKLMKNVVFVLSGFQNPYRAELRDKAVEMGAVYKPDWGKSCTHLVCAFVNTPKYKQVEGRGKIVSKKWIEDCYKQRKLLPWRQYRMGDAESPDEESEEEIEVAPVKPTPQKPGTSKDEDSDDYGGDTDSGEDTDEELRKIKEAQNTAKTKPGKQETKPDPVKDDPGLGDPYDVDTDEDEGSAAKQNGDDSDLGLPELPDFFADKHFFLYGDMANIERRLLTRYITAYAGELADYMSDRVNFVVSAVKWDKNFDDALAEYTNLVFVKPKWVYMCHEKTKLVPKQPYLVVPD